MMRPSLKGVIGATMGFLFLATLGNFVWLDHGLPHSVVRLTHRMVSDMNGVAAQDAFPSNGLGFVSEKLVHENMSHDMTQLVMARRSSLGPVFSSKQEMEQARAQSMLFSPEKTAQNTMGSPLANARRLEDDRLWIDYDMKILGARVEGDSFDIHLPGYKTVKAEIESVEMSNGQYRWQGRIEDFSNPGRFSISHAFADQYAVGSITVGTQEFLLEAKSGLGWITHSGNEFELPPDGQDGIEADRHVTQHP